MKIFEVPDGTRVSSAHLRTAKLARALDFDRRVLGLTLRGRGESTASFSVTTTKHMKTAPQIVAPVDTEGTRGVGLIGSELEKQLVAQTPLGRLGRPEDIARIAVFLASDDASWLSGAWIRASGGLQ